MTGWGGGERSGLRTAPCGACGGSGGQPACATPTARCCTRGPGPRQGGQWHQDSPRCACTMGWSGGLNKWSTGPGEAKRVCCATQTLAGARSQTKPRRNPATTCWGNGSSRADWNGRAPRHGAARAVGTDAQGTPASRCWGWRFAGARTARGKITSADLRTRVLRKSPVRANRPPGSVRGPSGNRRSYRDGVQAM
jgi:hypothetical protein